MAVAKLKRHGREIEEAIAYSLKKLKYDELKCEQKQAVTAFLSGNDTFVSLPTGYGKSLCYGILPLAFDYLRGKTASTDETGRSIVVCVSPLTSTMMDQRQKFCERGLRAEFVGQAQDDEQASRGVREGRYQLVFISPESLLRNLYFREMLRTAVYQECLVAFAVDEAHCVKKWGDAFRVDFAHLGEVRSLIPRHVNVMALTATATVATRKAVLHRLGMKNSVVVAVTPNKGNLTYEVKEKPSIEDFARDLCQTICRERTRAGKLIVFCRHYKDCAELYRLLRNGLGRAFTDPVGAPDYHRFRLVEMYCKPTEDKLKERIVRSFCDPASKLRVVIGTVAFGMGLDCPNVRAIYHWGPPTDLEGYIQETGRGGRDGLHTTCLVFYEKRDQQHTEKSMMDYCKSVDGCRRQRLFSHFDSVDTSKTTKLCLCCDICKKSCNCSDCN